MNEHLNEHTEHDAWGGLPVLGPLPHFHADPVAGVPVVSTDGHWWWDGYAWTPAPEPVAV